jgi:hypothetical protein
MYTAGTTAKLTGLSYRQLDHVVRNRHLRPSCAAAHGRGTVRSFSERDLVALRLTRDILGAGHRLGPFMHIIRYVQRGRALPPFHTLEDKVLVSNGRDVQIVDGSKLNLARTLEARRVAYVVDLGAAVRHVRDRIERTAQKGK